MSGQSAPPLEITPEELRERLAGAAPPLLVDVRQPEEHAYVRLPDSRLVPLPELAQRAGELPADADIVVYCHHGVRSLHAAAWLRRSGLARVQSLAGGIEAWTRRIDPSLPHY